MRILIFLTLFLSLKSIGQDYNTELLAHVTFPDDCADIWGYADQNGREYALVGRFTGTSIYDITDPRNPVFLKHIPGAPGIWREIKTFKDRAYVVADQGTDGILIIDLSKAPLEISFKFWNPTISANSKTLNISKAGPINRAHDLFIDENGFCYLNGSSFHSGVIVLDLNENPDVPVVKGIFNSNYSHGIFVRNDTAWSADIIAGEFSVWDVHDKVNPKKITTQRTGNFFTHSICMSDDNKYVFTTDERANAYLESYKIDDLSNITFLDKYRSRTTDIRNTIPHNNLYHNGFIVQAYYTDGFTLVDAHDPARLVEVGAFDTYPAGDGDFHGCWGVYPDLPSGNILASDIEFGMYIVKPDYIQASYLTGVVKDSITKLAISKATIRIERIPFNEVESTNDGKYKSGGPYTGETEVTISKAGYKSKTVKTILTQAQITNLDIDLVPLKLVNLKIVVIDADSKKLISNVTLQLSRDKEFIQNTIVNNMVYPLFEGKWNLITGAWGYLYNQQEIDLSLDTTAITILLQKGYRDDFIFNYNWTAQSTASSGIWGRAEPLGAYIRAQAINPDFDLPDDLGDQCMITGNGSTAATGNDVDRGYTRLISPAIDLSNYKSPILQFYAWTAKLNTVSTIAPVGGHRIFGISGNDTLMLDTVNSYLPTWTKYSIPINISKISNLKDIHIVFEANEPVDADARNIIEFGVDGFSIQELNATANNDHEMSKISFSVFPNPAVGEITILAPALYSNREILILNIQGKVVSKGIFPKGTEQAKINLPGASGVYFIGIKNLAGVMEYVTVHRL